MNIDKARNSKVRKTDESPSIQRNSVTVTVTVTVTTLGPRTLSQTSVDVGTNFISWTPTGAHCSCTEHSAALWPNSLEVKATCEIR